MPEEPGADRPTFLRAPGPPAAPAAMPGAQPAAEPDAQPEATSRRTWRARGRWAGAGAAVTVLVLVVAFLATREPAGPGAREELNVGALTVARRAPDLVPHGPIIDGYPAACGVPKATARELVPGSRPGGRERGPFADTSEGHCSWYALNDGEERGGFVPDSERLRRERVLRVDIELTGASAQASAVGQAMRRLSPREAPGALASAAPRIVTGLGEEGRARYSPALDEGATVRFRVGNAAVAVAYYGWDRKGEDPARRQLPEETAMSGALKVAAEVAKSLGVPTPSTPSFAPVRAAAAPIRRAPRPCDTVSGETLRKVAHGAYRERVSVPAFELPPMAGGDACRWDAHTPTATSESGKDSARHLVVTITTVTGGHPGTAVQLATREYLRLHHDARDGVPDATDRREGFTAVGGLGDQAFADHGRQPGGGIEAAGRVVFRLRNVLVQVRYHADHRDEDPLTRSEAVNGAYTVALDVAESLPRP